MQHSVGIEGSLAEGEIPRTPWSGQSLQERGLEGSWGSTAMALSPFSICEERGHVIRVAERELNISVPTRAAAHTHKSVAEHKENCQTEPATEQSEQTFPPSALPWRDYGRPFPTDLVHRIY